MTPDDMQGLIGRRYELGADGPDSYDWRGLLLHCQRTFFGKDLPLLPMGAEMPDLFADRLQIGVWQQVNVPGHGDAALLYGGDHPHVEIWLT